MEINDITGQIIDAAMKVHTALGPGLLDSAYEACLVHELRKRGLKVDVQLELPIEYDGVRLDVGYRIAAMNLMLHEIDTPDINYQNTLSTNFTDRKETRKWALDALLRRDCPERTWMGQWCFW